MHYSRVLGSKKDVASHLGVTESSLEERLAKNNNKLFCMPGKYWSGLKDGKGAVLTPVREYFLGDECVYAEFENKNGLTHAYMKFIDKSGRNAPLTVAKQIIEDGFESITPISTYNNGKTNFNVQMFAKNTSKENKGMSNLTEFDLRSLERFADDLESFQERVKQVCAKMESGIIYCQSEMKDEQSKAIMTKAKATIDAIMKCVNPSVLTLEKVKRLIDDIKNADVSL